MKKGDMKKILTLLTIFCLLVTQAGCDKSGPNGTDETGVGKGEITIVFVPKLTGNAFFESANAGVQAYAARHGFKVEYRGSPQALVSEQIAVIEDAIARKADGICISSLDAKALDNVLKKALAVGIKVVTWDSDVSGDARMLMVSQGTPAQLGRMLVEMGAKSLNSRGINPGRDKINYVWHYSQSSVTDQNSWQAAGEKYIRATYPRWNNVNPDNYYSHQDAEKAVEVGTLILTRHPDIDLIICNDSTSLPGQAQAARNLGLTAADVTITGFASPNPMRAYVKEGVIERWGLWDCQIQGALGCYLAYHLASGKEVKVGERLDIPEIGTIEVMSNAVLDPQAYTSENSGVVLLPQRTEFTLDNVDKYDF
jgi:AI-2 transport system substrate-binding protein